MPTTQGWALTIQWEETNETALTNGTSRHKRRSQSWGFHHPAVCTPDRSTWSLRLHPSTPHRTTPEIDVTKALISSVLIYRKCAQWNICLLHGNKRLFETKYEPIGRGAAAPIAPPPWICHCSKASKNNDKNKPANNLSPILWWLVWRSGNGIGHINKVKLHRAQLVLGLVNTFGGSTIPVFIQAHSAWLSLPVLVQRVMVIFRRWFYRIKYYDKITDQS